MIVYLGVRPIITNLIQPPLIRSSILNEPLVSDTNGTQSKLETVKRAVQWRFSIPFFSFTSELRWISMKRKYSSRGDVLFERIYIL